MQVEEKVDAEVVEKAGAILTEQSYVPVSPADYDKDGKVCLCAAGILAKAGLHVFHGAARAEQFEAELVRTGDTSLLDSTFETLGWSAQLCRDLRTRNDITVPAFRPTIIRSLLRELS